MKFDTRFEIDGIVSGDASRPQLANVEFDVTGKRLLATDGHGAAIVPCEPDAKDQAGAIPRQAIEVARKKSGEIAVTKDLAEVKSGPLFRRPPPATFPPIDQIMMRGTKRGGLGTLTIGLNPQLLLKIARAIGSADNVTLTVDLPAIETDFVDTILVLPWDVDAPDVERGPRGVIMPIKTAVPFRGKKKGRS